MNQEIESPYEPGAPSGPDLPGTKKPGLNKRLLIIGVIALLIAVAGTIVMIVLNESDIAANGESDNSIAAFIPIWVAVFVPFLARQKKEPTTKKTKKILAIAVSLTVALVLGTIILWLIMR